MDKIFTVNNILDILLRRLWLIIIIVCLGGGVAYTYSEYVVPKKYTSSITLYVYTENIQHQQATAGDFALSQKLVDTYMVILKSNSILEKVSEEIKDKLPQQYSAKALAGMISVTDIEETEIFKVSVTSYGKEDSKIIADAIALVAPNEIKRVVKAGVVEQVDKAEIPSTYSYPNISKITIIGIILGFVFACSFAIILDLLNTSVKTKDDLMETHKYPVLAVIPNLDGRSHSSKGKYGYGSYKGYGNYSSYKSYNYGRYGYSYGYGRTPKPDTVKENVEKGADK